MKKIIIFLICLTAVSCAPVQYATLYTTIEDIDYLSDEKGNIHQHVILADGSSFTNDNHFFSKEDIGSTYMYDIPITGKYAQTINVHPVITKVYIEEAYMLKGCRYASFFSIYNDGTKKSEVLAISVINYTELQTIIAANTDKTHAPEIPLELYNEICGYNPEEN